MSPTGAVVYEASGSAPRKLRLVRGLRNDQGQYNCFLNVILQSLWHLRPFREAMLGVAPGAVAERGAAPTDVKVFDALLNIFQALSAEEPAAGAPAPAAAPAAAAAGGSATATGVTPLAVSPSELREALSGLDHGQAAVRIEMNDMHDASEVLGEIFSCLHRAEVGKSGEEAQDLQLPQKVKVKDGVPTKAGPATAPITTVHRMFGMDVQVRLWMVHTGCFASLF